MLSPPPLPRFLPVPLTPISLSPILALHTPSSQRFFLRGRPTTRSHSTGEKDYCHGRKWFEDHYGVKQNINGFHPFCQRFLRTTIGSQLTPGYKEGNNISRLDYFLLLFPPNQLIQMTVYTSEHLFKHKEKGSTKGEMIKWFRIIILDTRFEFGYRARLWYTVSQ